MDGNSQMGGLKGVPQRSPLHPLTSSQLSKVSGNPDWSWACYVAKNGPLPLLPIIGPHHYTRLTCTTSSLRLSIFSFL